MQDISRQKVALSLNKIHYWWWSLGFIIERLD